MLASGRVGGDAAGISEFGGIQADRGNAGNRGRHSKLGRIDGATPVARILPGRHDEVPVPVVAGASGRVRSAGGVVGRVYVGAIVAKLRAMAAVVVAVPRSAVGAVVVLVGRDCRVRRADALVEPDSQVVGSNVDGPGAGRRGVVPGAARIPVVLDGDRECIRSDSRSRSYIQLDAERDARGRGTCRHASGRGVKSDSSDSGTRGDPSHPEISLRSLRVGGVDGEGGMVPLKDGVRALRIHGHGADTCGDKRDQTENQHQAGHDRDADARPARAPELRQHLPDSSRLPGPRRRSATRYADVLPE